MLYPRRTASHAEPLDPDIGPSQAQHAAESFSQPETFVSRMRFEQLLGLGFISVLLALCFVLTLEEAMHLARSRPNQIDWHRTSVYHPGCVQQDASGQLFRCDIRGYGMMTFLCSPRACLFKEPANGTFITQTEEDLVQKAGDLLQKARAE